MGSCKSILGTPRAVLSYGPGFGSNIVLSASFITLSAKKTVEVIHLLRVTWTELWTSRIKGQEQHYHQNLCVVGPGLKINIVTIRFQFDSSFGNLCIFRSGSRIHLWRGKGKARGAGLFVSSWAGCWCQWKIAAAASHFYRGDGRGGRWVILNEIFPQIWGILMLWFSHE